MRTAVTRYYHYVGLNRCADFLNFRQQSLMVCSAEAQLLGSKAYVGIGYARQLFNFIFHFGSTVSTAKVLQNIYTLNFIGIRHTAGAISQALTAYIAVFLMRMADFAITVSRMTGNVMSVYMSMFVAMVVTATAFVTVCMRVFMFVAVIVTATAFVAVCMSMFVFVLMVMAATACVTVCMSMFVFVAVVVSAAASVTVCVCVSVFFVLMVMSATTCVAVSVSVLVIMSATALVAVRVSVFVLVIMLMFITTAAIIAMLMRMLFMFMVIIVSATACITMSMLRHMSHSFVIMVLAAVTAGAAFRMLAVILYTIDMAVDVTKSSYIAGTVTDIF